MWRPPGFGLYAKPYKVVLPDAQVIAAMPRPTPALAFLASLLVGLAIGSAQAQSPPPPMAAVVTSSGARTAAEVDAQDCARQQGSVRQVGLLGLWTCVVPFADAGQACQSRADCTGACFAPQGAGVGERATGACQADSAAMFGCHALVIDGRVVQGLCID